MNYFVSGEKIVADANYFRIKHMKKSESDPNEIRFYRLVFHFLDLIRKSSRQDYRLWTNGFQTLETLKGSEYTSLSREIDLHFNETLELHPKWKLKLDKSLKGYPSLIYYFTKYVIDLNHIHLDYIFRMFFRLAKYGEAYRNQLLESMTPKRVTPMIHRYCTIDRPLSTIEEELSKDDPNYDSEDIERELSQLSS